MLVCDLGFSVTNASRFCSLHAETQTKLCGPGMKPFQLSKNPIQVNLFRQSYVVAFEIFTAGCDMLVIYYPPTPADSKGDTPGSKSFFGNNNQKKTTSNDKQRFCPRDCGCWPGERKRPKNAENMAGVKQILVQYQSWVDGKSRWIGEPVGNLFARIQKGR